MKALLLCAGFGTGLKPYTEKIPKPVLPILNVPLAFYSLQLLRDAGVDQFVVNTHHLPDQIQDLFSTKTAGATLKDLTVLFSDEQPKILDTGGGIWGAKSFLSDEDFFIVANTDTIRTCELKAAIKSHLKNKPLATMIAMAHPGVGTQYGGLWTDKDFNIHGFGKSFENSNGLTPYHYTGVQIVSGKIFKYLPDGPSALFDTYRKALQAGEKIQTFVQTGLWLDAGTPQEFFNATSEMLKILPKLSKYSYFEDLYRQFWNDFDNRPSVYEGVGCKHSLDLSGGNILLGNHVWLESDLRVKGFFVAGDNVEVGKNCEIENSVILAGAKVASNSKIKNKIIF